MKIWGSMAYLHDCSLDTRTATHTQISGHDEDGGGGGGGDRLSG